MVIEYNPNDVNLNECEVARKTLQLNEDGTLNEDELKRIIHFERTLNLNVPDSKEFVGYRIFNQDRDNVLMNQATMLLYYRPK